jgi:outer membrane protein
MSLRTLTLMLATLAVLSIPATGQAQGDIPLFRARPGDSSSILHGKLGLSLADAIKMGLENNLGVEVNRHTPLIANENESIAWGAYDPEWFSEFGYSMDKNPNANVLLGTTESSNRRTDGFGGFRGLVPWLGSSYEIQVDGSRHTTNNTIQVLSPELRSEVSMRFTQPLMKGLIWNEPWTSVKTNRVASLEAYETFRNSIMDTVAQIEDAYWALIAREETLGVNEKSLETAKALLDQTETQYEVGVVSKVRVIEAKAGLASREVDLIRSSNAYRNAQDVLIDLVLGQGLRAESTLEIEPTDRPEDYIVYDIDVPLAVERAFSMRPDLAAKRQEIERKKINVKFAENQRLPQLDAVLSYGNRGLAGSQNDDFNPCRFGDDDNDPDTPCNPANFPKVKSTNYGDTFDDYYTSDASDQFAARVVLTIPIPNTAARHGVSKAELELRQAMSEQRRLEQNIILEVRQKARNLKSAQEGIVAAERSSEAAAEQLRAEKIRLEYGESTPFDVLLRESDMVEAESEKINALQVYRTSATQLDRAQGTILQSRNIRLDEVSELRLEVR